MKLHQILSYTLMTTGALIAARSLQKRRRWEQGNTQAAIMLDWDDVLAVVTRAPQGVNMADLLAQYKENGATHLSLPELTVNRLLAKGQANITQGQSTQRIYLQTQSASLADLAVTELQARLPHIDPKRGKGNTLSFYGDLPTLAEVGLGFDPAHAQMAQQTGLSPVARPIGYSWVQPVMIDRTFDQAAALGCKIIAVQGNLIPGHEFEIQHTVEAMQRHHLTYAYFRESRHQKGDWFLAKHLASTGQVILAHEFTPTELLDEDMHTAAYRWGNLALEVGVRFCSVRFFRILHAADPLESVAYVHEIAHAMHNAGLTLMDNTPQDLRPVQPTQDKLTLAGVGLSAAGAVGAATDLLPVPDSLKLMKVAGSALVLGGLPFVKIPSGGGDHHHDNHDHDHNHDHHHHHGPAPAPTAYVQKGLALASTVAFPAAVVGLIGQDDPIEAIARYTLASATGAAAIAATTVDADYLLGIEEYRGYNLDWLVPLGLAAAAELLHSQQKQPFFGLSYRLPGINPTPLRFGDYSRKSKIQNRKSLLPLAAVGFLALRNFTGHLPPDVPATLDREHKHAHTHHLSKFQQQVGDAKMAISPRPLRKWSLLAPAGLAAAIVLRQQGRRSLSTVALMTAAVGQSAILAGFRQGQRPLDTTLQGRLASWGVSMAVTTTFLAVKVKLDEGR